MSMPLTLRFCYIVHQSSYRLIPHQLEKHTEKKHLLKIIYWWALQLYLAGSSVIFCNCANLTSHFNWVSYSWYLQALTVNNKQQWKVYSPSTCVSAADICFTCSLFHIADIVCATMSKDITATGSHSPIAEKLIFHQAWPSQGTHHN